MGICTIFDYSRYVCTVALFLLYFWDWGSTSFLVFLRAHSHGRVFVSTGSVTGSQRGGTPNTSPSPSGTSRKALNKGKKKSWRRSQVARIFQATCLANLSSGRWRGPLQRRARTLRRAGEQQPVPRNATAGRPRDGRSCARLRLRVPPQPPGLAPQPDCRSSGCSPSAVPNASVPCEAKPDPKALPSLTER